MSGCPSSGKIDQSIRNSFVECFAVTTTFVAIQLLAAKYFQNPRRVPLLLGVVIPLSYYTFTIMDHHTKTSDKAAHKPKSHKQRQALIILIALIAIRAYQNTPYAISYRWGIVSLIVAKITTNLPQQPRSQP
ncbi:MAG: hypothetical protein KFB93_06765 [Simkaniaceae bacterium]|nr:MAG: hypothetical protein KFB93_06765 [Simkaniaceae bacterium]